MPLAISNVDSWFLVAHKTGSDGSYLCSSCMSVYEGFNQPDGDLATYSECQRRIW